MDRIKTMEYKAICEKLNQFLLDDLSITLAERQAKATVYHKANQTKFLESFGSVNYSRMNAEACSCTPRQFQLNHRD